MEGTVIEDCNREMTRAEELFNLIDIIVSTRAVSIEIPNTNSGRHCGTWTP